MTTPSIKTITKQLATLFFVLGVALGLSACSQSNQIRQQHSSHNTAPRQPQTSQQTHKAAVTQHPARQAIINIAHSTVGTRYKWGGNNPQQGFDCSGLMRYVHKNALGLSIPRTAAKQRDHSRTISYAQLQPGDMLFFKTGKRTNHVGIYVGNREFVHASSGGKRVSVSSMDSAYWHSRFVKFGTFL